MRYVLAALILWCSFASGADTYPVCSGTVDFGGSRCTSAIPQCSVAWTWAAAGSLVAGGSGDCVGNLGGSGRNTASWLNVSGSNWRPTCSAGTGTGVTYATSVQGITWVCPGTASSPASSCGTGWYEPNCSISGSQILRITAVAALKPGLVGLETIHVCGAGVRRVFSHGLRNCFLRSDLVGEP